MSRSYMKNTHCGIGAVGRGVIAAHRKQLWGKRRTRERGLIAQGDFESLDGKYPNDVFDRPDDGRFRVVDGDFAEPWKYARK